MLPVLRQQGHDLTILFRTRAPRAPGCQVVAGDLLRPETYRGALEGQDAILHMAAVTHTNDVDMYYRVNRDGTAALLREATRAGIGRFAFMSSRAVGPEGGAYSESKAQGEELVRHSGLEWMIFRPAEVYGAGGTETVGRIIDAAAAGSPVLVPGDGSYQLAPLHIDDLIAAVAGLVASEPPAEGCYTLAGPESLSFNELLDRVASVTGKPARRIYVPLAVLSAVALLMAILRVHRPPIVRDQVQRLLLVKDANIKLAKKAIGFAPQQVEAYVAANRTIWKRCSG